MTEVRVREAGSGDLPFLWEMLLEATFPLPDVVPPSSLAELQADPHNSLYLVGWGRAGDRALVAEVDAECVGAAWFRLFADDHPAYGFVDSHTPELAIAVRADHRDAGVGTALLMTLIAEARRAGFEALSLSVAAPNPALRLYERLGFERVELVTGSWTMRLRLRPGPGA